MKKILIIIHPYNQYKFNHLPFGSSYLASILDKSKYEVDLYSCDASGKEPNTEGYDYVLVSSYSWGSLINEDQKEFTSELYRQLQELVSRIKTRTLVGGTIINGYWNEDLDVDLVVKGMVDENINQLLDKNGYEFSYKPNVFCKPIDYNILNIEDFRISHKEIFESYNISLKPDDDHVSTVFTRYSAGCNRRCAFCEDSRRGIKYTDIQNLKDSILSYVDLGFNAISFVDTYANANPHMIEELCNWLVRRNLNIVWTHSIRLDHDKPDFFKMLFESGCRQLFNGIESLSPTMLKEVKKDISLDKIVRTLEIIHDVGIINSCNVIVGLPNETNELLKESLRNIVRIKEFIDEIIINKFIMYNGIGYHKFQRDHDLIVFESSHNEMSYYEKRSKLKYSATVEKRKQYEIEAKQCFDDHGIRYKRINQHLLFSLYKQLGSKKKVREMLYKINNR